MRTYADVMGNDKGKTSNVSIDASYEGIDSLKGAPDSVKGDFDVSGNNLKSLKDVPPDIHGDLHIEENKFKDFLHCLNEVNDNILYLKHLVFTDWGEFDMSQVRTLIKKETKLKKIGKFKDFIDL